MNVRAAKAILKIAFLCEAQE